MGDRVPAAGADAEAPPRRAVAFALALLAGLGAAAFLLAPLTRWGFGERWSNGPAVTIAGAVVAGLAGWRVLRADHPALRPWQLGGVLAGGLGPLFLVAVVWSLAWKPPESWTRQAPSDAIDDDLAAWRTEDLPGLSVELPPGPIVRGVQDYGWGSIKVVVRHHAVQIWWWVDAPLDLDDPVVEVAAALRSLEWNEAVAMPSLRPPAPPELPAAAADLLVKAVRYHATVMECGVRRVLVVTGGSHDASGRGRLHDRVVRGVRCTPDLDEEALISAPPPVRIELPDDWDPRGPDEGGSEAGVSLWGSEGSIEVVWWFGELEARSIVRVAAAEIHARGWGTAEGLAAARVGARDGWRGHLVRALDDQSSEIERHEVAVVAIPCRTHHALVLYAGEPGGLGDAILDRARCD